MGEKADANLSTSQENEIENFSQAFERLDTKGMRTALAAEPEAISQFLAHRLWTHGKPYHSLVHRMAATSRTPWRPPSDFGKLHPEARAWCEALDVAFAAGLPLDDDARIDLLDATSWSTTDAPAISWLIDKGCFEPELMAKAKNRLTASNESNRWEAPGLVATLAAEGARGLALIEPLARRGALGGSDSLGGITDFVCIGWMDGAEKLASLGFSPEPSRSSMHPRLGIDYGLGPIQALLRAQSLPGASSDPSEAVEDLRWLVERGAVLAQGANGPAASRDPYYCLFGGGGGAKAFPSLEAARVLGRTAAELGADFNEQGLGLWRIVQMMALDASSSQPPSPSDEFIAIALKLGAAHSKIGGSAMAAAARCSDPKDAWRLMARLIGLGAETSRLVTGGESPALLCFFQGHAALGWKLIEMGCPAGATDPDTGESALHYFAAMTSKQDKAAASLNKLLEHQSARDAIDHGRSRSLDAHRGETALHLACSAMNPLAITALLSAGANANAQDELGWTPLRHLMRSYGEKAKLKIEPCLLILIEHGADPAIADFKGRTPAQAAVAKAPLGALAELLAKNPTDILGATPQAIKAKRRLGERGAQGTSVLEQIEINQAAAPLKRAKPRKTRL